MSLIDKAVNPWSLQDPSQSLTSPLGPSRTLLVPHVPSRVLMTSLSPPGPARPPTSPRISYRPFWPLTVPQVPVAPPRSLTSPHVPSRSRLSPGARSAPTAKRRNSASGLAEGESSDWSIQMGGASRNSAQQCGQGRSSLCCSGQPLDNPGAGRGQGSARRLEAVPGRRERGRAMAAVPVTTEGSVEVSPATPLHLAWPAGC